MDRGYITKIIDDQITIKNDEETREFVIPRSNIYGNHWTIGWHGSIIEDDGEVFFKADN